MVIEIKRSQLKEALDRVYERENEVEGEQAKMIKKQLDLSTILIFLGTLLVTISIMGSLYFNQITDIFPYIFIILFLLLGLAISIRIPIVLGNNLKLLKYKLNSTKSNLQINSIVGVIFICLFVAGATSGLLYGSTDQIDNTDSGLNVYEIKECTISSAYKDVSSDLRVNVEVTINAPKNIQEDNVYIDIESWFAGKQLQLKSQKVTDNLTVRQSILIHDAEDTSYIIKLIVNSKVIETRPYASSSNLYVYQSEVKVKPLLKNKAEVTIVSYNAGPSRGKGEVEIYAKSPNILGSDHEATAVNENAIESGDTWEATFTINIDFFETEQTEIDVYLKHEETTYDKEILIVESYQ
jgi:hypothetical protein